MSKFNMKFQRSGRFYMEGEVSVEIDSNGNAVPLGEVIMTAHECIPDKFKAYRATKLKFIDDEWTFYPLTEEKEPAIA